jgi:Zn-dependent protease with chaperone function
MSLEWIITGIILLGGMAAGGISLYVKRKREKEADEQNEFHI